MKLIEIRLTQEHDKSFIFQYDKNAPFPQWHNHPEYELVLVLKGRGRRQAGDSIERFEDNDLILMGPYLPHEWCCDPEYTTSQNKYLGECVAIQFDQSFIGSLFFHLPENKPLQQILMDAAMGCKFSTATGNTIIPIMKKMVNMDDTDRLYALFSIFQVLAKTKKYETLSSPNFIETFRNENNEGLKKCVQYILQNFQGNISKSKMLELSHMSSTAFLDLFKKTYRMTFIEYLLKIRIGYACRLLIEDSKSISAVSNESGFDNISNFYRHFKKIKKVTPAEYKTLKKVMQ
jgi:AraC-like DNA-binding protein